VGEAVATERGAGVCRAGGGETWAGCGAGDAGPATLLSEASV
jgi:hypothetical protein